MRNVIVSINVTLDGFMAGIRGELDWHFPLWNEEMSRYASQQLSMVDTILIGRVTYQTMAAYWPYAPKNDYADMMNNHHKIVFSKSSENFQWNNTRVIHENIREEILKLKLQAGQDMIIFGSGTLVSAFMKMGLINEYRLWVHPVILGYGKPLFKGFRDQLNLKLVKTKTFHSGVVVLHYQQNV